jgi:hypothetical protein
MNRTCVGLYGLWGEYSVPRWTVYDSRPELYGIRLGLYDISAGTVINFDHQSINKLELASGQRTGRESDLF